MDPLSDSSTVLEPDLSIVHQVRPGSAKRPTSARRPISAKTMSDSPEGYRRLYGDVMYNMRCVMRCYV